MQECFRGRISVMLTVEDGVNGTGGWSGVGVGGRGQHLDNDGNGVCVGGQAGGKGIDGEVGTTVVESKSEVHIVIGSV